ncbi:2-oxo acid dehydrogenase subunit E2, partial [Bacillus altitudinis]|uniref:2-oxo acid dehydrogenase subunit E2 n=1 Tax=Bacillus altitudinis TaxID=293387 RepID=UPI002355F75D
MEVDVRKVVRRRNEVKDELKGKEGFNLRLFGLFVKGVGEGLKELGEMKSMWGGDKIVEKKGMKVCIAVGTDEGVFVAVVKGGGE